MKEGKSQKNFKISIRAKILTGMIACDFDCDESDRLIFLRHRRK